MNLQVRDPRARALAEQLARKRGITLTEAVITALEAQLRGEDNGAPTRSTSVERHALFAARLKALGRGEGREMTKDEIDEMWGH